MKNLIIVTLCAALLLSLAACGTAKNVVEDTAADAETADTSADTADTAADENTQIPNPWTDITVEDAAAELNFSELTFPENVTVNSVGKCDGTPVIYQFNLTKDGVDYTFRLALDDGSAPDISGVYFSGDVKSAEYDSADAETFPTVSASSDGSYAVASGTWKGYVFCVIADGMTCDDIYTACNELVTCLPLRSSL